MDLKQIVRRKIPTDPAFIRPKFIKALTADKDLPFNNPPKEVIVKTVKAYYCPYCNKRYLANPKNRHVLHCISNPYRECRMCGCSSRIEDLKKWLIRFEGFPIIVMGNGTTEPEQVHIKDFKVMDIQASVGGCPNCTLMIVKMLRKKYRYYKDGSNSGKVDITITSRNMVAVSPGTDEWWDDSYNYREQVEGFRRGQCSWE